MLYHIPHRDKQTILVSDPLYENFFTYIMNSGSTSFSSVMQLKACLKFFSLISCIKCINVTIEDGMCSG